MGLALLLLPAYPIGANDVFEYLSQGELLARFGLNPMVHTLSETPDLTWFKHIAWLYHVSYYGPLWTWIEAGIVRVIGTADLVRLVGAFKLAAIESFRDAQEPGAELGRDVRALRRQSEKGVERALLRRGR